MIFERAMDISIQATAQQDEVLVTGLLRMSTAEMEKLEAGNWEPVQLQPAYVTRSGRVLTEPEIEKLAAEAERGYDIPPWAVNRLTDGLAPPTSSMAGNPPGAAVNLHADGCNSSHRHGSSGCLQASCGCPVTIS